MVEWSTLSSTLSNTSTMVQNAGINLPLRPHPTPSRDATLLSARVNRTYTRRAPPSNWVVHPVDSNPRLMDVTEQTRREKDRLHRNTPWMQGSQRPLSDCHTPQIPDRRGGRPRAPSQCIRDHQFDGSFRWARRIGDLIVMGWLLPDLYKQPTKCLKA